MEDLTDKIDKKSKRSGKLSRAILYAQFIFFGGWTGVQIILQPQDLSVFVNNRGLLDNFFFTLSYSWQNIPLLYLLFVAIAIIWNHRSITLDFHIINEMKSRDGINPVPLIDKDNIIVFITTLNIIIWAFAAALLYFVPYWDLSFVSDMIYDFTGAYKFKEPLYILFILAISSINIFLRHQLLLFYKGGYEYEALSDFFKAFLVKKMEHIKSFLIILLATTLSALVYKQLILDLLFKIRKAFSVEYLVNLPLMVNRVDVLRAIPAFILLFLVSSIFFSPLIIFIYKKILRSQYELYKDEYLKEKRKIYIDENNEVTDYSDNII